MSGYEMYERLATDQIVARLAMARDPHFVRDTTPLAWAARRLMHDGMVPAAETVRVRIPISIDHRGDWAVACDSDLTEAEMLSRAWGGNDRAGQDHPSSVVWVEVSVPIPSALTVEGRVAS